VVKSPGFETGGKATEPPKGDGEDLLRPAEDCCWRKPPDVSAIAGSGSRPISISLISICRRTPSHPLLVHIANAYLAISIEKQLDMVRYW